MAKLSNSPKYYVYYDKRSGEIIAACNERSTLYKHELITDSKDVEKLISGEWKLRDYLVSYTRLEDDTVLSIIPKADTEYAFRNSIYEWIGPSKKEAEVVVEWNKQDSVWKFSLSKSARDSYDDGILVPRLNFFVTLESDFDFLIRTITIDAQEIINREIITIPFSSVFEQDINKISIGSKLVFKSYKLEIKS